jgi:hypothetical protein
MPKVAARHRRDMSTAGSPWLKLPSQPEIPNRPPVDGLLQSGSVAARIISFDCIENGCGVLTYEQQLGDSFDQNLKEADRYFVETAKLHSTLAELARRLEQEGISYAALGAIALARYGYRRMTGRHRPPTQPRRSGSFSRALPGARLRPAFNGQRSHFAPPTPVFEIDVLTAGNPEKPNRNRSSFPNRLRLPSRSTASGLSPWKDLSNLSSPRA